MDETKEKVAAISMGDPAGVGPEITLRSFVSGGYREHGTAVVVGDFAVLEAITEKLGLPIRLVRVEGVEEAVRETAADRTESDRPVTVPVLDAGVVTNPGELEIGKVSALAGKAAVTYINNAVDLCMDGRADGLATGPINKESVRAAGFSCIGHTEMISEMSNGKKGITMFLVDKMRIFFHSRHLSLRQAVEAIDTESVLDSLLVADRCLKSMNFSSATIALAALNPHASDGGLFGTEEADYLVPARDLARKQGVNVVGPVPADSVFHLAGQGRYDAVLSLYHDQGHVASKTYDFYRTVSVTFGYPFLRTSVDHGTALDIAWQGKANPVSMEEAVLACFRLAPGYEPIYPDHRQEFR